MNERLRPNTGQLVIIDDDHLVRDFTVHTIEYGVNRKVLTFDDGFTAWQYLQSHADRVDVVIADVNIPEMDGLELLTRFKDIHADKDFIITTSNPSYEHTACKLGADAFLLKPFDIGDLFILVRKFIMISDFKSSENLALFPIKGEKAQTDSQGKFT